MMEPDVVAWSVGHPETISQRQPLLKENKSQLKSKLGGEKLALHCKDSLW